MNSQTIKEKASRLERKIIENRRHLHRIPELGFEEWETSRFVASALTSMGLEVQEGVAKTGVVGLLRGGLPGKTIALRADMDALPVAEQTAASYQSTHQGKMHACGHDAHVAAVLGAAMILTDFQSSLKGNIKFIFQPAEETIGGAKAMIEEGVLENPTVDGIIAGHVWSSLPAGTVEVKGGPVMASTNYFNLTITGNGGHAAQAYHCVDPIVIGCEAVSAFQKIVSRQMDPFNPVALSICSFHAGDAWNVIPEKAVISGTVRTLDNELRAVIGKKIETIARGITEPYGAGCEFDYTQLYPVTRNHEGMAELVGRAATEILGEERVMKRGNPSMSGEDFAYFLEKIPGVFIKVGIRNEATGMVHDLHSPHFDIDESALSLAAAVYAMSAILFLHEI